MAPIAAPGTFDTQEIGGLQVDVLTCELFELGGEHPGVEEVGAAVGQFDGIGLRPAVALGDPDLELPAFGIERGP